MCGDKVMTGVTAYLGLGANLGDCAANMRAAVEILSSDASCSVVAVSSLYRTRPVGIEDQPDFLNAVVAVRTTLAPRDLLALCKEIEHRMGRVRTNRWGPRVIDVDILLYEGAGLSEDDLAIPHSLMMERAFVLVPLAEITPEMELRGGLTAREAAERVGREGVKEVEGPSWAEPRINTDERG